jgi:hypothetical protein
MPLAIPIEFALVPDTAKLLPLDKGIGLLVCLGQAQILDLSEQGKHVGHVFFAHLVQFVEEKFVCLFFLFHLLHSIRIVFHWCFVFPFFII